MRENLLAVNRCITVHAHANASDNAMLVSLALRLCVVRFIFAQNVVETSILGTTDSSAVRVSIG